MATTNTNNTDRFHLIMTNESGELVDTTHTEPGGCPRERAWDLVALAQAADARQVLVYKLDATWREQVADGASHFLDCSTLVWEWAAA